MTGAKLFTAYLVAAAAAQEAVSPAGPDIHWAQIDIGLGIPFNVVIWTIFGAGAGVWWKRVQNKGDLSGVFLFSFVMTVAAITLIPRVFDYQWNDDGHQAAVGMALAFTSQVWVPEVLAWLKSWAKSRRRQNAE